MVSDAILDRTASVLVACAIRSMAALHGTLLEDSNPANSCPAKSAVGILVRPIAAPSGRPVVVRLNICAGAICDSASAVDRGNRRIRAQLRRHGSRIAGCVSVALGDQVYILSSHAFCRCVKRAFTSFRIPSQQQTFSLAWS